MKAIILAAGKSTRLRPFTNKKPKVMMEIGGKPITHVRVHFYKGEKPKADIASRGDTYDKAMANANEVFGHGKDGAGLNLSEFKQDIIMAATYVLSQKDRETAKTTPPPSANEVDAESTLDYLVM